MKDVLKYGLIIHGISPDFPFKSNYVDVHGSKMHYVDEGSGTTPVKENTHALGVLLAILDYTLQLEYIEFMKKSFARNLIEDHIPIITGMTVIVRSLITAMTSWSGQTNFI